MLGKALIHLKFDVETAADGKEALELINRGPVPELVLMDFEMPGLDGVDVCQRIRTSDNLAVRELPVIMLTAHSDEADEIRCLTAGASDFVTKPASRAVLEARIRTQLRLRALNEEMRSRHQELARWRRDHEADLISARATQQGLLPSALPNIPGWRVETHFQPVIQVGGDMLGWRPLRKDQCLFWVVDATGHGAAAALLTTLAALLVNHACEQTRNPGAILARVNEEFSEFFQGRTFMTACCAAVSADGTFSCAGAGHPAIFVRRANGSVEEFPSRGTVLGLRRGVRIDQLNTQLEPGDSAILYTDGLFSLRTRDGTRFAPQTLCDALATVTAPEKLLVQIREWYAHRSDGGANDDDVAVVVIHREEVVPNGNTGVRNQYSAATGCAPSSE